jgi:hypothetical protein
MTILTPSALSRATRAELRGYALLGFCMILVAAFVAEIWSGQGSSGQVARAAAQPAQATSQVATAR